MEAGHHAREEGAAIAIAGDPGRALVLAPELLGGVVQEVVHVGRHLHVRRGAAHLEDARPFGVVRAVRGHPDGLDEEVGAEDGAHHPLGLGHATGGLAEVAERVAALGARVHAVDVVLEHQALGRGHRRLRLVLVGALGEGEELRDPLEHLDGLGVTGRRRRGDPAAAASIPSFSHTSRKAGPCEVSACTPSTSCTYWCAISCLSTSTTTPHGFVSTSCSWSSIVRICGTQRPRRVDAAESSMPAGFSLRLEEGRVEVLVLRQDLAEERAPQLLRELLRRAPVLRRRCLRAGLRGAGRRVGRGGSAGCDRVRGRLRIGRGGWARRRWRRAGSDGRGTGGRLGPRRRHRPRGVVEPGERHLLRTGHLGVVPGKC